MASEPEVSEISSFFERLVRNRDLSLFIPFFLGLTNTNQRTDQSQSQPQDPDQETDQSGSTTPRDRLILINPFTQGMVVIEGTSSLDALLRELSSKDGQPPASKASIEAMPNLEVSEDGGECVICLEEWEVGGMAKEMPCKHRFHPNCIDKWLGIHGSCPVCRYKMPVEEEEVGKKRDVGEGGERRRVDREIWVSFSFNSDRRSGDSNQNQTPTTTDSSDASESPRPDHEMDG